MIKHKEKLIRKLFLITENDFEILKKLKKSTGYSYSELVRMGVNKLTE